MKKLSEAVPNLWERHLPRSFRGSCRDSSTPLRTGPSGQSRVGETCEAKCPSHGRRTRLQHRSGQALVEFMFVAVMLLLLVFGLIDFCRAISTRLVITNLSREGSNLASRNTPITNAVQAVIDADAPLDIDTHGRVIITAVANDANGNCIITNQFAMGGIAAFDAESRVGLGIGTPAKSGWIPTTTPSLPVANQTVYVTEVFYEFKAVTPVGQFLSFTLPSPLYDVAYF